MRRFVATLALSACTLGAYAQLTKAPRIAYGAYWSNEGRFRSTIQLHNNLVDGPLTVRPVLYSPTGDQLRLEAVTLPQLGNASIDMLDELTRLRRSDFNNGSIVFQYESAHPGSL